MSSVESETPDQSGSPGQHHPRWRRTLYASWFAQLLSISAFSAVMPFIPFYIRDLGVEGQAQVSLWSGITMTASGMMLTIFSPIWGNLSDRFGRKIMVERAMFGGCIVLGIMGMVTNVYQLAIMRAVQGCLTGTMVASTTLVSSVTPRDRIGSSLGFMQTAILSGATIGPWIGGFVADHWGYRVPFYISSALLLTGGLTVLFLVEEDFDRQKNRGERRRGLRKAFGSMGLVALLSVFFFITFSGTFVAPIFPLFVEKIAVGYKPASVTGLLMGFTGIAAGLGAIMVGRFADRMGHRRMLVSTTLCSGLLVAPQALVRHLPELFGLRVLGGFASGGTSPVMNSIIGTTAPAEIYGRAYGTCQAASSLGMATGPLVGAYLSTHLGLRWPFAVMGGLLCMCSLLVYSFIRPGPAAQSEAAEPSREAVE